MTSSHEVTVLQCTFNGERHLEEQISSIAAQIAARCHLRVSDDGSTDATLKLLDGVDATGALESIIVEPGPGTGFANNFLSLLARTAPASDYFAFCDQDDIWDADKLDRAISAIEPYDGDAPLLYCSRSRFISEAGVVAGQSPLFCRPPSFANALIQNIAGGNTMVFNRAAMDLLQSAGIVDVASHDWWVYMLITGAGGQVIYDPQPGLGYRQHAGNVIGANTGTRQRAKRYLGALQGRNQRWNARNVQALERNIELLTPESQGVLQQFKILQTGGLLARLRALRTGGFYAQTPIGNLALYIATLLKKM